MTKQSAATSDQSAQALYEVLRDVAAKPANISKYEGLKDALGRQGKLAQLSLPGCGVHSMALNTLKHAADRALQDLGGFAHLDAMRRSALAELQHFNSPQTLPRSGTRDDLRIRLAQAKARNRTLREDLGFVSERLTATLSLAQRCAMAADELTQATFRKQRAEILTSLGLRRISTAKDPADDADTPKE